MLLRSTQAVALVVLMAATGCNLAYLPTRSNVFRQDPSPPATKTNLAVQEPSSPAPDQAKLPEPYRQAITEAFEDIRLHCLNEADEHAYQMIVFEANQDDPFGQRLDPTLGVRIAGNLLAIRQREKQLFASMPTVIPRKLLDPMLKATAVEDLQTAADLKQGVTKRFEASEGELRHRYSHALGTELQSLCEQRKQRWYALLRERLAIRSSDQLATVTPSLDEE